MAAPTHTSRVTPSGNLDLYDGFVAKVTFAADSNVTFWEKADVKLPMFDGGEMIDRSTMFNTTFRTKHFGALVDVGEGSMRVAYCLQSITDILALINVATTVTYTVCDGSQFSAFGGLKSFDPQPLVPGEHPTAIVTIGFTMYDHVNNEESTVLITEVTGT